MAQNWTDDTYAPGHVAQTDLQNMENNFQCLKSLFSGNTAPANAVAGMPWFDTAKKVLKVRDAGNLTWYGLMHGDLNQKVWIYRDTAMDGWVVDTTPTDRVLAIKGGTVYTTGGQLAGSWQLPDHVLDITEIPAHSHSGTTDTGYENIRILDTPGTTGSGIDRVDNQYNFTTTYSGGHTHTFTTGNTGGGAAHNHGNTFRPAAAVGTLQYLDI